MMENKGAAREAAPVMSIVNAGQVGGVERTGPDGQSEPVGQSAQSAQFGQPGQSGQPSPPGQSAQSSQSGQPGQPGRIAAAAPAARTRAVAIAPQPTRVCARCTLPDTFPGIRFDEEGVCQFCREAQPETEQADEKARCRERFEALIDEQRGRAPHDVVAAYSGGKDSTYILWLFRQVWGLRVMAVTVDNGFIAEGAMANMRRVTDELGVDHVVVRPNAKAMRAVFRTSAKGGVHSGKSLLRASDVCTSCISVVKGIVNKAALESGAPFVGWGWSPGQAPGKASVMRQNPLFAAATQRALREPLRPAAGDAVDGWFPADHRLSEAAPSWNIHPLAFMDYAEDEVVRRIAEFGWVKPDDTDPNSSNCLLNAFGNTLHLERYGFHPYAMEIAGLVRTGCLNREEGLRKLGQAADPAVLERVLDILYADAPVGELPPLVGRGV